MDAVPVGVLVAIRADGGAARVGDVGEAEQRGVGRDLRAEAEDVEGRDAGLAGEAGREGDVHRCRQVGGEPGRERASGHDRRRETEVRRVPDDDVLGAGSLQRVDDRADVGGERGGRRQDRPRNARAAADRGERRARVVAAAGDDVEAVGRSVVAGGREVLGRLDEEAERKAARAGARGPGRGAAEREVGSTDERRRERQADHRREVARPHQPVAVRARRIGVRGNVGVAGDDLGRIDESESGVVAAVRNAVAEDDEGVERTGAGGCARQRGDDEG
jgi:hypothetical protein